ncbi:MurR/RpiR family transcriptional regulator [Clostridium sp. NSJ-145]|uniref:MurR/RpiR family transcriptional regulator n=1 Tax=Clostridium sp. NSJ-145 TaxID=2897777 RepID=UPI001E57EB9E|nr:MurR/RpiR family transcriptional regulator [Clostridium sp. NSJ-145]MCD2501299.1 MurR/RpiR family transcriptional regulator [Clostridium sp. NSJ-145]
MSCIFKIKEGFNSFTNTEKKLANYILKNKEEVVNLSAQELSDKADISPAAVVRFSKTLGYKGFTALKVDLAKDRDERENDTSVIISENDSINDIIRKVKVSNTSSIDETIGLLNVDTINNIVEAMVNAKRIYLFGIGASGIVAMDLQQKLLRINKNSLYQMDPHTQISSSVHITNEDVAIGISYSGETKEVNTPLKIAKENGAKTIAITRYNKNSLSKIADYSVYLPNDEKDLRVGAITSRIDALTIVDILYLGVAKNDFERTKRDIKKTRDIINRIK